MAENRLNPFLVAALRQPYAEYWAELGQFVHEFSATERTTQALLRHLARVTDPVGAAVFSGVKVDTAISYINRICDARNKRAMKARLKEPLEQLGTINGIRNNIIHWGAEIEVPGFTMKVSNHYFAASPDRVREFRVSPEDLRRMRADLYKIGMHLSRETITARDVKLMKQGSIWMKVIRPVLEDAWQYKPPPQQPPRQKTPKRAQARQRQRASSRKSR